MRSIEQHLLPSVCHATTDARDGALASLKARHAELGDAKALFAQRGQMSSDVSR